jgi:hypothetical protein
MEVPFFDLKRQYKSMQTEIDDAFPEVFDTCWFVAGPSVDRSL